MILYAFYFLSFGQSLKFNSAHGSEKVRDLNLI